MSLQRNREQTVDAFLDAAERLLVDVGYASVTTRRLAEEAGLNHGLVHYYFGSMEELFLQVLERYTRRLIARQRDLYARDVPFIEKWRTAMGAYFEEDVRAGYPKVRLELEAMAWNRPEMRERLWRVYGEWRAVLTEAFDRAMDEYGLDRARFPVEAVVALVLDFNHGMQLERLVGIDEGHRALLDAIDRWLEGMDSRRRRGKRR